MEKFPVIRMQGSPSEIGYQHGSKLKQRIHDAISFYKKIFGRPEAEILDKAKHFKKAIFDFNQKYCQEIEAIAKGADVDPLWIYALNSRSEILTMFVNECTAIYSVENKLLAQNWDWAKPLEDLAFIAHIVQEDGKEILMMTEPGIIGKIGFNSHGIGVCLNFLHSLLKLDGVPIHIMLRAFLETSNIEQCKELAQKFGKGNSGNILVGDDLGNFIDIEFTGTGIFEFSSDQPFVHTNHFLGDEKLNTREEKLRSSRARYKRATELVNSEKLSIDGIKKILQDKENEELPICRPYIVDPELVEVGTVCTIIMDLKKKQLHITKGNPYEHQFVIIELNAL